MDSSNWLNEHGLGALTLNGFGERFFFNLNRHVFDKLSAHALFDGRIADRLFCEDSLIIVIGTDSGLLPGYLRKKGIPKGSRYVFIEPDAVLDALNANGLLDPNDERVVCVALENWRSALQQFKIADYCYIDGVKSLNALCAEDDFIDAYAELSWHVTEVLSQLHWQYSVELGLETFITRQIQNVADNRWPAKWLENVFAGQTAVLLAGGPSLDQALPWVKAHRDSLVVLAVSRIARQLLVADIEPDFIFSVDPTDLSFDISKEMLNFSERTVFICSHHVVPTLLNQWLGKVFYLGDRVPWTSDLNVANLSSAGPTVTNTALNVARAMGFKRVILAGVDLCFSRDGFTHAKGSDESLAGPRFNLTSLQVETNSGTLAPTSCDFSQAIRSLAAQAKILAAAGCQLINLSSGAAKIDNIDHLMPEQLIVDDHSLKVRDLVEQCLPKGYEPDQDYVRVLESLRRARFQVRAIGDLSEKARQINEEMYISEGVVVDFKQKKQLDQVEKKLRREHRQFNSLVKKMGIRRLIKLAKPFDDEEWTPEEARQLGDAYYAAYAEGAKSLLGLLDDAIGRVIARQMEHQILPDLDLLIGQCEKDLSFGRVRLWHKCFSASVMDREAQKRLEDLEQRFRVILQDKNTQHFARAKGQSNLAHVKQRAGLLFKHRKFQELGDLLVALDKVDDQQVVALYRCLVEGYCAELQGKSQLALECYQQIVDHGDGLLEEALIRISGLSLADENGPLAQLALQCLSQINPYYLPLYAEILRLQGDMIAAVDAYSAYIALFPKDLLIQMKLAGLYSDQQLYEGAAMMLNLILQQQPDFPPALEMREKISVFMPSR